MWYSGPHLGTTSDIKLYEQFTPPLLDGERLLGDKVYVNRYNHSIMKFGTFQHFGTSKQSPLKL